MSDEKEKEEVTPVLRPNTIVSKVEQRPIDEPKQGPPVDVNSDITPITRQPILQVDASNWEKMNVMQLHNQLEVLEQRFLYAQQLGHEQIINQLNLGLLQLRLLIYQKTPDEIKLI